MAVIPSNFYNSCAQTFKVSRCIKLTQTFKVTLRLKPTLNLEGCLRFSIFYFLFTIYYRLSFKLTQTFKVILRLKPTLNLEGCLRFSIFYFLFSIFYLLSSSVLLAQTTHIKGRVTDASSGDGLPFVNVCFKNSQTGVTTDFEGYFEIKTQKPTDSLAASYVGYLTRTKKVEKNKTQTINFQLHVLNIQLAEVEILPGVNPAFRILDKAIARKEVNDKRILSAYQYDNYSKIQIMVDKLSEKYRKKKVFKPIINLFDSLDVVAGEEGKAVLPVFVSETISEYYFLKEPLRTKEIIKASKITGVGVDDQSFISQLMGSSFQVFNFYENWVTLLGKTFISPIADGGKLFYTYILKDSLWLGNYYCYEIKIVPKRPLDLAFNGTVWINDTTFALKQIDLEITKDANLNYINRVKIQQDFEPTHSGPWLPVKTRILIDLKEVTENSVGMIAKFYNSSRNIISNQPNALTFYDESFETNEDAFMQSDTFWDSNRHEKITSTEAHVYKMIDTLKKIPAVKTVADLVDIAVNGYMKTGKVDLGPYIFLYSRNTVEGNRIRVGFRTNYDFSKRLTVSGYTAYGFKDNAWKYNLEMEYILRRKNWTTVGIQRRFDIDQVGITDDFFSKNNLFAFSSRLAPLDRLSLNTENRVWIESTPVRGLTGYLFLNKKIFEPKFEDFIYYPEKSDTTVSFKTFHITEVVSELRYSKTERFLQKYNQRISVGIRYSPVYRIRYTHGFKIQDGILKSDFLYDKLSFNISQKVKLNTLGNSFYSITLGKVFSKLPYPLLEVHKGNETVFSNPGNFFLMNFFEFVSDEFVTLIYEHHFEGLFLNRIPLMNKLKWRELVTANMAFGRISRDNNQIVVKDGKEYDAFSSLSKKPYLEAGVGVENILNFIRIDAVYRLAYIDKFYKEKYYGLTGRGINPFGIKVFFQFRF
ncbi:MAG: hypothetical protein A3H98_11315 [Bacteroidetes bacterium RIFCSPLOWO2_02_FULL_36_8]|nr:MAG: hypothetical protein A3H98_11315 [Bacteroidetes bacterium RIFCSPLOWO2_02_FULL_36_8]OFY69110.1 MAG: hypothetical protein A3G23_06055 [Bacteroidetes bacterium RIFCSPLOWO2_12_FULL_37_12]